MSQPVPVIEPPPPARFDRPSVAPFWRVTAVLSLFAVLFLGCMVVVLIYMLSHAHRGQPNNGPFVGPGIPVLAAPAMGMPGAAPVPGSTPYPTVQDPPSEDGFPPPHDEPKVKPAGASLRAAFLDSTTTPWTNMENEAPDRIIVSPDGTNMACTYLDVVMAGPLGGPLQFVAEDRAANVGFVPNGRKAPMRARWGPVGLPAARASQLAEPDGPRAHLWGWTPDGTSLYWTGSSGRVFEYLVAQDQGSRIGPPFAPQAAPRPKEPHVALIANNPRAKLDFRDGPNDHEIELVVLEPAPADAGAPRVFQRFVISAGLNFGGEAVLSPDGKRIAVVYREEKGAGKGKVRLGVLPITAAGPGDVKSLPASADRFEGLCWTPDGKAIIYGAGDLFEVDIETGKETRLTQGATYASPSVTGDGTLFFLNKPVDGGVAVELRRMKLNDARDLVMGRQDEAERTTQIWVKLAAAVLKDAGDAKSLATPEAMAKIDQSFARLFPKEFKQPRPATAAGLDQLRHEVEALIGLDDAARANLRIILGAIEGEYLRRRPEGATWLLAARPWDGDPEKAQPEATLFGAAFNPFRRRSAGAEESLTAALYRAAGRPLVIGNAAPADVAKALDGMVDPNLDRGIKMLANPGTAADGERILLDLGLSKKAERNAVLTLRVLEALSAHDRSTAARKVADRLVRIMPEEARYENALGVARLATDQEPNESLKFFEKALRCDLKYGPAYLNLALGYEKIGKRQEARQCLRRYLELLPNGDLAEDAKNRLNTLGDVPVGGN
jgi:tetratricopeptide (TPR) repeat protein